MTDINIVSTDTGIELTADNHAGNKVICAVCSANCCNLINILEKELDDGHLDYLRWDVRDGYCRIEAETIPKHKERFKAIVDTVMIGFNALAENYPKHIKVKSMEGRD